MNRREFISNIRTLAAAGCALGYTQVGGARDLRPVLQPPTLNVARGAETPVALQSVRIDAEVSGSRALTLPKNWCRGFPRVLTSARGS